MFKQIAITIEGVAAAASIALDVSYGFAMGFLQAQRADVLWPYRGPVQPYFDFDPPDPDRLVTEDDEVLTIPEAASELGMTLPELIEYMAWHGLRIKHPNGGYIGGPHPDLVPVGEAIRRSPTHPAVIHA